jgi:molybdopterin-containing oxidoreductase family membrane subunit
MGRPWLAFWMFPYPNYRGPLWINFRSPLVWDFFAIATYFTISVLFWYLGLIPDLAAMRDRAHPGPRKTLLRFLSLGWNSSTKTWLRYETVYGLMAGLATALVISVHTIVSWDFATSIIPGWHSTIFPPYFVVGAIFSGMAMVLTLSLIMRKVLQLENYITKRHIGLMCMILLFGSLFIGFCYLTEYFYAAYSGEPHEVFTYLNRISGPMGWLFLVMLSCNVLAPQLLWLRRVRLNLVAVFLISIFINLGMWLERFIIIVGSLQQDFLPSSWATYKPTSIEIATLVGSFGLFLTGFLLFCRLVPTIALSEVKSTLGSEGIE